MKFCSVVKILVLAISLFTKSWGVCASDPEGSLASGEVDNVVNLSFELPREIRSYSQIQGEILSPAQLQWSDLRKGCDPQELQGILERGTSREFIATEWLRKNALQCSKKDLIYVANNVQNWSEFAMYDAIRLAYHYAHQI
jgi:hypothetical protein